MDCAIIMTEKKPSHQNVHICEGCDDGVHKAMLGISEKNKQAFHFLHRNSLEGFLTPIETLYTNATRLLSSPNGKNEVIDVVASISTHSHLPNATFQTMLDDEMITLRATQDIFKGEEITMRTAVFERAQRIWRVEHSHATAEHVSWTVLAITTVSIV